MKETLISNIIHRDNYDDFKGYAKLVVAIGTCLLVISYGLSFICHYKFVFGLLNLFTGTSLLFIFYIFDLILLLEIEVDVETQKNYFSTDRNEKKEKPLRYKLSVAYSIFLILMGICAIYFSNEYKHQYAFDCTSFLVDRNTKTYHLIEFRNDCEIASQCKNLEVMKGYQIDDSYKLCVHCEQFAEDAEWEYNSNRFFRK